MEISLQVSLCLDFVFLKERTLSTKKIYLIVLMTQFEEFPQE